MSVLSFFQTQEGKAIPAHPALMDRSTPIEIVEQGRAKRARGPISQVEAKRHLNAYGGKSDAIDHVMNCVRLYADAGANAPWHLEKKGKRLRRLDEELQDASIGPVALYNLLDKPNPHMDYEEMISLLIIDLLLVGNAYWFKWKSNDEGQPLGLWRLAPPYVKIRPGQLGPEKYLYTVPESGQREPLKLDPADVLHFKLPNPHDPLYGLGVIQGGARPLDLELALTEHQASYFEKGTNPSMVVQSERRVPRDVMKKLAAQMRGRYSGPRNAGDLMVLEAGLTVTPISPDAAKAQFEAMSKLSRDRILAMFRVHPKLLGITGAGDGADKAQDAQRVFDHNTLQPFFGIMSKRISRALAQAYDVDFVIDHRYRMPKEEQVKLAGDFASIPGVTVREVRQFLDLPPTGDDEIDELVLNLPGEEGTEDDSRNGFPDRNLPGEGGRPPAAENTRSIGVVGQGVRKVREARVRSRRPSEKALEDILWEVDHLRDEKAITLTDGSGPELGKIEPPKDPFGPRLNEEVDAIVADLASELRDAGHVLERALLDHVEGKAFNARNLRSRVRRSEAWANFQARISEALETAAQRALSRSAMMWGGAGLKPEDEIDYESIAKEIVYRKDGVRAITKTLRDEIAGKIGTALEAGGGREEVEAAVREGIGFWQNTKSETVAMTEAVHAFNEGTLTVAEMSGVGTVFVQDGDDHDDECKEANGQIWSIEKARDNRLEHPRCRRSFLPVQ